MLCMRWVDVIGLKIECPTRDRVEHEGLSVGRHVDDPDIVVFSAANLYWRSAAVGARPPESRATAFRGDIVNLPGILRPHWISRAPVICHSRQRARDKIQIPEV